MKTNKSLIEKLKTNGTLRSKAIEKALLKVDRKKFVPEGQKEFAYFDNALPIAEGQTISQPTTVVIMLELLDVKPGEKVLDIGAGSGWVSCLLSELVGEKGEVFAFEINQAMGSFGEKNIKRFGAENLKYKVADVSKEWTTQRSYDRIYAGAAFKEISKKLLDQLKIGGVLVAPLQDSNLIKITKVAQNDYNKEEYFGFAFVPFIKK